MSKVEDRFSYLESPTFKKHLYADFNYFYVVIALCSVLGGFLLIWNVFCCCCSKYSDYWLDRHTGNRWLVSIWSATPHKQPSLDYTELEKGVSVISKPNLKTSQEYLELQKRESDI